MIAVRTSRKTGQQLDADVARDIFERMTCYRQMRAELKTLTDETLALMYGCSRQTIWGIISGRIWTQPKQRQSSGMSFDIAQEIRGRAAHRKTLKQEAARHSAEALAAEYDVGNNSIYSILNGRTHPHLRMRYQAREPTPSQWYLSEAQVADIAGRMARGRKIRGEIKQLNNVSLAEKFECCSETVRHVILGNVWPSPTRPRMQGPITFEDALLIRDAAQHRDELKAEAERHSAPSLAAEYNCSQAAVYAIMSGRSWAHLRLDA